MFLLRTQSDERLVALAAAGHERAFEAIVERYRRELLRACRRVLPEARAEDAVQQTLVAAWTALRRGDEVRALRPWLHRIAHNTALNQLRMAGYDYDELREALTGEGGAEEELERRMIARSALSGLAALPERQREALLQIAVHGRGQEEVARVMGVSEPAVRQLVRRARVALRGAATAVVPMPFAAWAAGASGGLATTAAEVGAVVVIAGGAAATPVVVDRLHHGAPPPRPALSQPDAGAGRTALRPQAADRAPQPRTAATPSPAVTSLARQTAPAAVRTVSRPERDTDRRRGPAHESHSGSSGSGSSGSGSSGSGSSRSGPSRSGPSHSGSGSGDEPVLPPPPPVVEREDEELLDDDHSGPGPSGGDEPDDSSGGGSSGPGSGAALEEEADRSGSSSGSG